MRKFKLSVHQYKAKLESEFGYADPEMVKRYAEARKQYKLGLIDGTENVFAPCTTCGKKSPRTTTTDKPKETGK